MSKLKKPNGKNRAAYIAKIALYPLFMLFRALGKSLKLLGTQKRQLTASAVTFCMIVGMLPLITLSSFAQAPGYITFSCTDDFTLSTLQAQKS